MNTTSLRNPNRRALWPYAVLLLGPVLSGCGGGGSAGPATTTLAQPATVTLSGTLLDPNSVPLVGYKVTYAPAATAAHARRAEDTAAPLSAVTDGQGHYSLSIPVSQATPGATLSVFTPDGTLVSSQTITIDPSQPVQTTVTTAPAAPTTPAPPVNTAPAPPAPPTLPA